MQYKIVIQNDLKRIVKMDQIYIQLFSEIWEYKSLPKKKFLTTYSILASKIWSQKQLLAMCEWLWNCISFPRSCNKSSYVGANRGKTDGFASNVVQVNMTELHVLTRNWLTTIQTHCNRLIICPWYPFELHVVNLEQRGLHINR